MNFLLIEQNRRFVSLQLHVGGNMIQIVVFLIGIDFSKKGALLFVLYAVLCGAEQINYPV